MPKLLSNVKEDIITVSRVILSQEGYEKFSMREISSKCGIALGTIYNYFRTKDEIVTEIIMSDWFLANRRMDLAIHSNGSEIEKLESIFMALKDFVHDFHNIWIEMAKLKKSTSIEAEGKCRQYDYRDLVREKIKLALGDSIEDTEENKNFIYDLLARNFLSYCQEKSFDFTQFRHFIETYLLKK